MSYEEVNIENCLVNGFKINSNEKKQSFIKDLVGAFVGQGMGACSIDKCVFVNTTSSCDYPNKPSVNFNSVDGSEKQTGRNCYLSNVWDGFVNLGTNLITGGKEVSGQAWYYYKEYNDKYRNSFPMLRSFMSWKTMNFKSNDTSMGNVDINKVEYPSDGEIDSAESTEITYVFYGIGITAERASTLYKFVKWTYSSSCYTANFEQIIYTVAFKEADYMKLTIVDSCNLAYGTKLEASFNKATNELIFKVGSRQVAHYKIEKNYTLEYFNADWDINANNFEIVNNKEIQPKAKLKTYTPSFG